MSSDSGEDRALPDDDVMRYVVGQFEFLANLIEMGGQVCEKVETVGHGYMCKRHGWPWTDSKPCPATHTISRGELVTHLRMLGGELAEYLGHSDGPPDA